MFHLNQQPGRTVMINGEEYLFFSGYSYLGMSHVPEFVQLVKEGMDKYGIVYPSSRISNTRLSLYQQFEEKLSVLTGMEASISFSSGYLAGQAVAAVLSSHQHIFISPEAHPAVNYHQPSVNLSAKEWPDYVLSYIEQNKPGEAVLIFDSLNTSKGCINNFSLLDEIPSSTKIICLVDDSHGIGLLGQNGEGIINQLPKKENTEYIFSYSLSKAFHLEGGAVSCSLYWAQKIKQQTIHAGSTPVMPAFAYAFLQADGLYKLQREKLQANINLLAEKLNQNHYVNHYGLPIFALHPSLTEEVFAAEKIIISSFGYPNPDYDKINRAVISALHTESDLVQLAGSINSKI